ncbi:MAG: Membrane-bound lytic murein transglycosylase B precursor [bacterium ADurb.Bin400]|nr:MAG: Membrane-bound lytic murein transglycosylase B precursor [bacterium ADurb.Bin400]
MTLLWWRASNHRNTKSKLIRKINRITSNLKKFASVTALGIVLPTSLTPILAGGLIGNEANSNLNQSNYEIKFNSDSPLALNDSWDVSEIVPGESVAEREAREQREKAEALAKEQAAKKRIAAERATIVRERRVSSAPTNLDELYLRAEAAYGVDARLLRAIHYVETGQSGSTSRSSYAGAVGPMQFMPSTWRRYGVDGNNDGVADITNVEDAVFAAANYLRASGYPNVQKALWSYNPSHRYYSKVMNVAYSFGFEG